MVNPALNQGMIVSETQPSQPQSTNIGGGLIQQISPQDLSELDRILNQ